MKRFITYLYQYDRGVRSKNTGFIKADIRENSYQIEIQARSLDVVQGTALVSFIVCEPEVVCIPVGEFPIVYGKGVFRLRCTSSRLGNSPWSIGQTCAIAIRYADEKMLISSWTNQLPHALLEGNVRIFSEAEKSEITDVSKPIFSPTPQPDTGSSVQSDRQTFATSSTQDHGQTPMPSTIQECAQAAVQVDSSEYSHAALPENSSEHSQTSLPENSSEYSHAALPENSSEHSHAALPENSSEYSQTALPENSSEHSQTSLPEDSSEYSQTTMQADSSEHAQASMQQTPAESDIQACSNSEAKPSTQISYRKISLSDIKTLPKKNWYMCNNSFLIHGFFNYRYLMLKTVSTGEKKELYLGVPGIYERPEYAMALVFGFPDFEPADKQNKPLENGVFGYWMTQLLE